MRLLPRILLVSSAFLAACGSEDVVTSVPAPTEPAETPNAPGEPPTPPAVKKPDPKDDPVGPNGMIADLRADTNRDGAIKFDDKGDNDDEDDWTKDHGAVFLANIDDDEIVCPTNVSDIDLAKCNDAADETINGDDDALDLARLQTKPWPEAPANATATITFTHADKIHLFKVTGTTFTLLPSGAKLTAAELKKGVEFAVEGLDIVRDTAVWDGKIEITYKVDAGADTLSDKVVMRIAPVLTFHHLSALETAWASSFNAAGNAAMREDLGAALTAVGLPPVSTIPTTDAWAQDFFEPGYMSMPAAGGTQHVIRVNLRSANIYNRQSLTSPLRTAGRAVFVMMRGKDVAGVQQWDNARTNLNSDSLNSFGNFETIPPYKNGAESFPMGRVLRGKIPTFSPDATFLKLIESQSVQPPVYVDTSWLAVGHVDETMSFVKASTPRGWKLLVNDATAAKNMLLQASNAGNGNVPMFVGKVWSDGNAAQATINQVLSDTSVMSASAEAAVEVAAQVATLKAATGLTDDEIIRIPFLHEPTNGASIAYQPGMVNGIYVADGTFVAPDPHGPVINGQDIFKVAMTQALAPLNITVRFAEDWDTYHRNMGEVHCGSNSTRKIPTTKWWESGR